MKSSRYICGGYFEEKIDCHNRAIYVYDEDKARKVKMSKLLLRKYKKFDTVLVDEKEYMDFFGIELN